MYFNTKVYFHVTVYTVFKASDTLKMTTIHKYSYISFPSENFTAKAQKKGM